MSDEIKSAYEIAMEKLAAIEEPTTEEKLTWKYVPEGEKLAAAYLKGDADLIKALAEFDAAALPYVKRGLAEILLPGLRLPHTEIEAARVKQVAEAIRTVTGGQAAAEELLGRLQQVFDHYNQTGAAQIKQAREQLKQQMTAKVQQALAQQMGGNANLNIDIETQPEFQAEWRKLQAQLEGQYDQLIEEIRTQLKALI